MRGGCERACVDLATSVDHLVYTLADTRRCDAVRTSARSHWAGYWSDMKVEGGFSQRMILLDLLCRGTTA